MTDEQLGRLKELAARFIETDKKGMPHRWEFGRALLPLRKGGRLTQLAKLAEATGVKPREIQYCLKFAEVYDTEEALRMPSHFTGLGLPWCTTVSIRKRRRQSHSR